MKVEIKRKTGNENHLLSINSVGERHSLERETSKLCGKITQMIT